VGLGGAAGGQGLGQPQGQDPAGREASELGDPQALVQVLADQDQGDLDVPLGLALERAHRQQLAAVPHGRQRGRPDEGRVEHGVRPGRVQLPDGRGEPGTARHHVTGPEPPDQGLIRGRGVRHHGQALMPPKLDRVPADRAG
jgi:hypothetical protein